MTALTDTVTTRAREAWDAHQSARTDDGERIAWEDAPAMLRHRAREAVLEAMEARPIMRGHVCVGLTVDPTIRADQCAAITDLIATGREMSERNAA